MKNDKKEETMEDFLRCVKKDRRPWLHPISPFERLRLKIEIGKMLEKGEEEEGFLSSVLLYLAMKNPSSPLPEIPLLVLKQQAKKGDKPSLFLLGLLAERGILPGVNEEEAFPFFLLSGLEESLEIIGEDYLFGKGTTQDIPLARKYLEKAAPTGRRNRSLGFLLLEEGKDDLENKKGYLMLKKEEDSRDGLSSYLIGKCYLAGKGVRRSDRLAFSHFILGVEYGNKRCCKEAGFLALEGRGTEKDPELAYTYFQRDKEDPDCLREAGICLEASHPEWEEEILQSYRKAALLGDIEAGRLLTRHLLAHKEISLVKEGRLFIASSKIRPALGS